MASRSRNYKSKETRDAKSIRRERAEAGIQLRKDKRADQVACAVAHKHHGIFGVFLLIFFSNFIFEECRFGNDYDSCMGSQQIYTGIKAP